MYKILKLISDDFFIVYQVKLCMAFSRKLGDLFCLYLSKISVLINSSVIPFKVQLILLGAVESQLFITSIMQYMYFAE